jgi:hypothetical protein
MSGTLTNGTHTVPWNNPLSPGADWRKASRTDLDPIVKDCVIVAALPDAVDFGHDSIPDGTRMIGISDDKSENAPVLAFSRVEFRVFAEGIIAGEFTEYYATDDEMASARRGLADVVGA